jgi:hypothetical protein
MTKNTTPTNRGHQPEPGDLEQTVASQDQAELSESQAPLNRAGPSSTPASGRKPLFGR